MKKYIGFILVLVLFSLIAHTVIAQDDNTEAEEGSEEELGETEPEEAETEVEEAEPEVPETEEPEEEVEEAEEVEETEETEPEETEEEEEEIEETEVEVEVNPETGQPVVSVETENEVVAMQLTLGAKVRLLQLEKVILRNILKAEKVIEFIQENYPDTDVSELEGILEELRVLREEVAGIEPQANDEETVKQFVDLKNDAISLSKQFRDAARELLEGVDKSALLEKFNEIDRTELEELTSQIIALIREYNAQRVERVFSKIAEKKPEFVEKIRNGEMALGQVRAEIGKAFKALKPLQRKNAFQKLREVNTQRRVFRETKVQVAKLKFLERRKQRLEQRIGRIRKKLGTKIPVEKIENRIRERIKNPNIRRLRKLGTVKGVIGKAPGAGE